MEQERHDFETRLQARESDGATTHKARCQACRWVSEIVTDFKDYLKRISDEANEHVRVTGHTVVLVKTHGQVTSYIAPVMPCRVEGCGCPSQAVELL